MGEGETGCNEQQDMTQLIDIIESGFPKFCHELLPDLREYYQFCKQLYAQLSLILYRNRSLTTLP